MVFWAGLVVGILLVTLLMALHVDVNGGNQTAGPPPIPTSSADAQGLVQAWQKMVSGTWVVDSNFSRTVGSQPSYSSTLRSVQRPPDYLDESGAVITGSIGGRNYVCASADQGTVSGCRDNGAAVPYSQYADSRVEAVRQAVVGVNATYSVHADSNNCFQVFQNAGARENNWGIQARFCFDAQTGASVYTSIQKDDGVDTTVSTKVAQPTDADLVINQLNR